MTVFKIKKKNEIINDILIEIVSNVDDVTDVNVGSVLRTLVEALGVELSDLYSELETVYKGTRIDTATEDDLENLGKLLGIERKQGTKSQGYVSFIRRTPATTDFTIPSGAIISTQPNTAEEQLRFVVKEDTTFLSQITDESNKFINGIYEYSLNERFIDSIQSLTGTAGGVAFTFTEGTDFSIVKDFEGLVLDPDSIVVLDSCDSTTDWNASTGATAIELDNADYKQGNGSLKLGKSTTTSNEVYYDKVIGSVVDGSNKNGFLWLKISDTTALNKLNYIKLTFGSGGSIDNSYSIKFSKSDLSVGWNMIKADFSLATVEKLGFPNRVAMNYLRITLATNNAEDTLTSGDVKMDFWLFGTSEDYIGDVVRFIPTGTLPDNNTNFLTTYKPLSKEVLCESEAVGKKYNISKLKITYKVSYIANIDSVKNYKQQKGGTDEEADDDLRERIRNATELKGKATVEALRQAVLGVEGVTSISIDDMPERSQTNEAHTHISFATTPTIALDFEVAQDNDNFVVSGTRGGANITFVKNTDYYLQDSVIHWVDDSKDPDDNTTVYVSYDYRWLGHVRMFVAGTSAPLASEVVDNINTAINDTRAAGVDVEWAEPSVVIVDVDCSILIDTASGYSFDIVKEDVKAKVESFLNEKGTGKDVYIAELVDVIMEVSGVLNVVINQPASDVSINVDEVARAGSITITQI